MEPSLWSEAPAHPGLPPPVGPTRDRVQGLHGAGQGVRRHLQDHPRQHRMRRPQQPRAQRRGNI